MTTEYTICTTSSSGEIRVAKGSTPASALKDANTKSKFVNARKVTQDSVVSGKIIKTGNRVDFVPDAEL